MTRLALITLACLATSGCLADLRPDTLQEQVEPASPDAARALLQAAAQAQRPADAAPWSSLAGVEVRVHDAFFGLTGWVARPWPENPQTFTYRFRPGVEKGVVAFEDGDGVRWRWGIHDWNTWTQEGEAKPVYEQDDDILFWLPTLQYFLEMAFRLPEAEFVDLGGEVDLNGRPHQRVYLTWQSYAPNDRVDQYLAFVDVETQRLTRCDFTVRDVAGFILGRVFYSDFRQVGDTLLPHRIEIGEQPPEDLLHRYTIQEWRVGVDLPATEFAPEPQRPARSKP